MITLIAAIGDNNEIGLDNKLLWKIPEDMKHFKNYTIGKILVMGRKTFESIGSKPLPGREAIVISSSDVPKTVIPAKTIEEALDAGKYRPELVVIGGASIYEQTIDVADKLVITHVDAEFEADTFFPRINLSEWKINNEVKGNDENYTFRFVEYIRYESKRIFNREADTIKLDK